MERKTSKTFNIHYSAKSFLQTKGGLVKCFVFKKKMKTGM